VLDIGVDAADVATRVVDISKLAERLFSRGVARDAIAYERVGPRINMKLQLGVDVVPDRRGGAPDQ
jgi:hypothetical protein